MLKQLIRNRVPAGDDGQITVLVLGYTAIVVVLVVVGLDASAAFVDRQSLNAAADDAAVAAAGAVDAGSIYGDGLRCGQPLPLDADRAGFAAAASVAGDTDLHSAFSNVSGPRTTVDGPVASVTLTGTAHLPLQGVVGLVDPGIRSGVVITVTSHAQSPTVAAGGC